MRERYFEHLRGKLVEIRYNDEKNITALRIERPDGGITEVRIDYPVRLPPIEIGESPLLPIIEQPNVSIGAVV